MYLRSQQIIALSLILASNQYHSALFAAERVAVQNHPHTIVFITSNEGMAQSVVKTVLNDTDHSDAIKQMSIGGMSWFVEAQNKQRHAEWEKYQHIEGAP